MNKKIKSHMYPISLYVLSKDELVSLISKSLLLPNISFNRFVLDDVTMQAIYKKIQKMTDFNHLDVKWYTYHLVINQNDEAVGLIGYKGLKNRSVEVGYYIAPYYRRQNYSYQALMSMIEWTEKTNQVDRITATRVLSTNIGSQKVLEKCGFDLDDCTDYEKSYSYHFTVT
ncbi:hypothetical protein BK011_00400 [Tenericutes bacterium MZ-XQ]|nr:hypothetical protein BK011_00400 [Tenericutes bacterium MZ-XQ]